MPGFTINGFGAGAPANDIRPHYKYTWDIPSLFESGVTTRVTAGRRPLIYAIDAGTPSWDFDKDEVQGSSLKYKYAKAVIWNDIKITWYDTTGLAEIIRDWRRMVWTPETGLKLPNEYKKESILRSLTFDWEDPVIWTLKNSWPQAVKTGDLSYTTSEVKIVDVTVAYDWAVETPPGVART